MSLDIYDMTRQVENDLRDRHNRATFIDRSDISQAHRHPLVMKLGRACNRLGDYLQGLPAPVAPALSPEPSAG